MRNDIIEFLEQDIKARCERPNNFFGIGCYYHIKAVVKNASILAKEYEADEEVVIISSWLHDKCFIEEVCVADAISHFDSLPSLFYLAYEKRNYGLEEGKEFVRSKLKRSYNKLSANSKKVYEDKYNTIMEILS